jgi:hypothetical protein
MHQMRISTTHPQVEKFGNPKCDKTVKTQRETQTKYQKRSHGIKLNYFEIQASL